MTLAEYLKIDRDRIHALTGPIFVEGAEPGDVLQVDVLEVAHKGWGWTSVVSGLGFLKQRFAEPFFFIWKLEGEVSHSIAPAVVPLAPVLRRDGRGARGRRRISHASAGHFRRQHGCARAVHRRDALFAGAQSRRAFFRRRRACRARRRRSVHQRNRMPCGRHAALPGAQAARASGAHGRNSRGDGNWNPMRGAANGLSSNRRPMPLAPLARPLRA